jgi:plastocyanin
VGLLLLPAATLADKADRAKIEVSHGTFEPSAITVKAGKKVVFKNVVEMPGGHTIAFEEIDAESEALGNGEKWSHTFTEPGVYHFYVKEHPDNKGTVTVK